MTRATKAELVVAIAAQKAQYESRIAQLEARLATGHQMVRDLRAQIAAPAAQRRVAPAERVVRVRMAGRLYDKHIRGNDARYVEVAV